jgi:hypothetical protein
MNNIKEDRMKDQKERTGIFSRRSLLTGSAVFAVGGVLGRATNAYPAPTPKNQEPPPLPWKWPKLDPLEAGRRAYRAYLEKKG